MHMWYYYVVKKVGCRYSVYIQEIWNSGSNYNYTHCNSESSDCCFDKYIL